MARTIVASQLWPSANALIREALSDCEFFPIGAAPFSTLPEGTEVLIPLPPPADGPAAIRPLDWPGSVSLVLIPTTGLDRYPEWIFDAPCVANIRDISTRGIAEHVIAMVFANARDIPQLWINQAEDWRPMKFRLVEGATLGIFGLGKIGTLVARKALALGMKVLAMRNTPGELGIGGVVRVDTIADLFERSEHVVLCAPATAKTRRIVNASLLARSRPGLHLINVARGALIDDDALIDALDAGLISTASLDVADPEPLPDGHPFYTHPRIRLSPHVSWSTDEVEPALARKIALAVDQHRSGQNVDNEIVAIDGY